MRARGAWALVVSAGWMMGLAGCRPQGPVDYTPPTPTGIIFLQAPPAQLAVNARVTLEASMTDANGPLGSIFNTPISWTASCGSAAACGSFDQSDEPGAVTYTAPATIPKGGTVTVTATGAGLSVSATVTIVPPLPIVVALEGTPPASLVTGAAFKLAATITNDTSPAPEVTWSAACGGADCGSFSPTTTGNEDGTTYTAPAAIPAGGTVTLTAKSVADPTKAASATVAITAAGATLANGTYVFQIAVTPGYDASFVTGVLVAANGTITGGEQDVANYSGTAITNAYTATQKITGGSYGETSDGNLLVTIDVGAKETETLEGRLSADGHGVVAGLDGAPASGTLDLQTSTAGMTGGYAVSLSGGDEIYEATWIAGVINVDGAGTISGHGSVLDAIDPGQNAAGELTLQPSTVSGPDPYGRVELRLYASSASSFPSLYLAGYMVDGTRMLLVETGDTMDTTNFQGVMGGTALAQGASTGQYSAASLVGQSYVFGGEGFDENGELDLAGVLTAQAGGKVTGLLNWNDDSGTPSTTAPSPSPLAFTGSYSVDPTGRVTLYGLTDGSTFSYTLHLYLAQGGNAEMLSSDANDTFNGEAFLQQADVTLSGTYGVNLSEWSLNAQSGAVEPSALVGTVTADARGAVGGYVDAGPGLADLAVNGTLVPGASGVMTGMLAGFTPGAASTANNFSLYLVDGTRGLLMETDGAQLVLGVVGR